jgi:dTDP-4-dehydrorhamnose reductase
MIGVIGQDSLIGRELISISKVNGLNVLGTSRRAGAKWIVDFCQASANWNIPQDLDLAIICASRTKIAECESFPSQTGLVNVSSTLKLVDLLGDRGVGIVFLSSSLVFSPRVNKPSESTAPEPVNEYGRQKLAVEEHLLRCHPTAKIIRLAKIVHPALPLFSSWRLALANGTSIQAYSDLFLSSVSLRAAAEAILQIALCSNSGIFHISASDALSYYDVARFLADLEGVDPSLVQPSPSPQPNTPDSTILSCSRTMETISFRPSTSLENLSSAFARATP